LKIIKTEGFGTKQHTSYLEQNPNSLIYSSPQFIHLVANHLEANAGWLVATDNVGNELGMLPYIRKAGPLGEVFNSLAYYGSNGGVVQHKQNDPAKIALIKEFYNLAKQANAVSATIINNPLEQDSSLYEAYTDYDFKDERIGQITHFPNSLDNDDLMSLFSDPRPRNIRKAIKCNVVVEKNHSIEAIEFLYSTHVENMKAIGGLAKKKSFFDVMPDLVEKKHWTIYLAKIDEQPVAALLLFYFNNTVEYFTPVILEEYRNTQALALVIYQAMQDAMENDYKNWNWGGTWLSQGGVYDFKKRWGTSEYRYYYYTKVFNKALLQSNCQELTNQYSGFFLIPYKYLNQIGE
jgi:hypothetical protein